MKLTKQIHRQFKRRAKILKRKIDWIKKSTNQIIDKNEINPGISDLVIYILLPKSNWRLFYANNNSFCFISKNSNTLNCFFFNLKGLIKKLKQRLFVQDTDTKAIKII